MTKCKVWRDRDGKAWVMDEPTTSRKLLHYGLVAGLCAIIIVGFSWLAYIVLQAAAGG